MRILLVEDDEMLGDALGRSLAQEGFTVDRVRTAEDADLSLRTVDYSLILLDLGLPDKGGLEFLAELRASRKPGPGYYPYGPRCHCGSHRGPGLRR